jgi:hypothetical protein
MRLVLSSVALDINRRYLSRFGYAVIEAHCSTLERRPDLSQLGSITTQSASMSSIVMKQHRDPEVRVFTKTVALSNGVYPECCQRLVLLSAAHSQGLVRSFYYAAPRELPKVSPGALEYHLLQILGFPVPAFL